MRTYSPNKLSRRLQALENRWCPAVTIGVENGIMRITGDNGANSVTVTHDGAGHVGAVGDGTTRVADGIKKIVFDLKRGDDAVTAHVTGELTRSLDLHLNLGAGNDTADLKFAAVREELSVWADLGVGDDRIDLNLDEEIRTGAAVHLDVRGRDGADTFVLSVNEVRADANLYTRFDGAAGADVLEARLGDPIDAGAQVKIDGNGGAGDDQLIVDGTTYCTGPSIVAGGLLEVELDGGHGNDTAGLKFEAISGELVLRADLGAGDDRIDVNLDQEIRTGGAVQMDVRGRDGADTWALSINEVRANAYLYAGFNGAAGNDVLAVAMGDPIDAGAQVKIDGDGGAGDDSLTVDATSYGTGANIGAGALLWVELNGGNGNDMIRATYEGDVDGELYLQLDGDRGNDTVSADVSASAGSTGEVWAWVNGGDGNDTLTFMLYDLSAGAAKVNGWIDGGKGFDTCVSTPNVVEKNCEA